MIYVILCLMENLQARDTLRVCFAFTYMVILSLVYLLDIMFLLYTSSLYNILLYINDAFSQKLQFKYSFYIKVSKKSRAGKKKRVPISREEGDDKRSGDHPPTLNDSNILTTEQATDFSTSRKDKSVKTTTDGEKNTSSSILPDEPRMSASEVGGNLLQMDTKMSNHMDDLCCSIYESSSDEQPAVTNEVDFKVSTFVSGFANSSIIQNLCWLLKFYKTNSIQTNDYIVAILRRVTDELELSPMLYQVGR